MNQEFVDQISAEGFHPSVVYAFKEMESNDARIARIAQFESDLAELEAELMAGGPGGNLGCLVGCLLEYATCRRGCGYAYPCSMICDAGYNSCASNCQQ